MKVLFLMTVIMTSIALKVKNLVPAEQLKLLPVSAPHKENANTTNTFLQLSATPGKCSEANVGGGWTLVRSVGAGNNWYKATDQLLGTDVYGVKGSAAFSIKFENAVAGYDQFLFATGDCQKWLIADKNQVLGWYSNGQRQIVKSSMNKNSYKARWYRRKGNKEDPWISLNDHGPAIGQGNIMYGENNFGSGHATNVLPKHGGARVFIRNTKNPATTEAATEEPSATEAGTRSSVAINLDFSKLVHEKFSQEAAHGTWNLHLNLDTDPCSLLTCKAESQCHAVGTCTKAGGGVCTTPFLAKDTECDDEVEETDNDVCDGEGGCAGINIGLGCLEMRFDASKFKEGYLVTTWKDLAKKGHDATAHSTVPRVLLDQTDKKRPYVPVIKGKWWNVPGNTFLKTIVSVFRSGDNRAGWHGHGATLARRSGRNSNWLFENGNGRLHGNQYPDKVWKNGKALTRPFDMAPINKFFVLVVQVNDRDTSAKTYYLGRGDADTSRVDIQEELGYDRILTDVERKQVESFLMKKWNIEN